MGFEEFRKGKKLNGWLFVGVCLFSFFVRFFITLKGAYVEYWFCCGSIFFLIVLPQFNTFFSRILANSQDFKLGVQH
ncbi:hypothetical protein [Neobacillus terrae]|uniref:hypothetical protein n=1 Tax=Neobacillus terrae TaxID=3034837 RepID=UPI001FB1542F|nr:hypothetical protein [Neobacillus terrae]